MHPSKGKRRTRGAIGGNERRSLGVLDRRFVAHWPSYVGQTLLAAGAVLLALMACRQQDLVVVASLAATAFTVFTMPRKVTASPRNVIGGHSIGLAFGSLFALIPLGSGIGQDVVWALAVGASMLAMVLTNTEHPPATGTALGVAIAGVSVHVVLGVVIGVGILLAVQRSLLPFLRDLTEPPDRVTAEAAGSAGRAHGLGGGRRS